MTQNCDYDSLVGVILPVDNIDNCTPHIEINKNTPTFSHFLPKTQWLCFC